MLPTKRCGRTLTGRFVLSDQVDCHCVFEQLNPRNICQLDIDLVFRCQIVEMEEHVKRAKLYASTKIHDVPVALQECQIDLVLLISGGGWSALFHGLVDFDI